MACWVGGWMDDGVGHVALGGSLTWDRDMSMNRVKCMRLGFLGWLLGWVGGLDR